MFHNKPMAILRRPKYKSTFKDFLFSLAMVVMLSYCMYLISELPTT